MNRFVFDLQRFDYIYNRNADSLISGTAGDDIIDNDGENSTINAGAGNDEIDNNGSYSVVNSGEDNDTITNDGENSTLNGESGNDYITNNVSNVSIYGGAGNDTINNGMHKATIDGGAGRDSITNSGDNTSINGGVGDDTIYTWGYNNTISGGASNDSVESNQFNSGVYVYGGGNDTIGGFGIEGDSFIVIENYKWEHILPGYSDGSDNVHVINVLDDDGSVVGTIKQSAWERTLHIVSSLDEIPKVNRIDIPQEDNQFIKGTSGRDYITSYFFDPSFTNITIDAGKGDDHISSDDITVSINGGAGNDTVFLWYNKRATVDGGDGDDVVDNWSNGHVTFNGGKGNDTIFAADNSLILYNNGDGNDYITGFGDNTKISITGAPYSIERTGNDNFDDVIITVGEGKITLEGVAYRSSFNIIGTLESGGSTDTTPAEDQTTLTVTDSTSSPVTLASTIETVDASARTKEVRIMGNSNANSIYGGSGKDILYGDADSDTLLGNAGNDSLNGGDDDDKLNGGAGADTLQGGKGDDTLTGGSGADIFLYTSGDGNDLITDYAAEDKISILSGAASLSTSGDDVIATVGKGNITIKGGADKQITYVDKNGEQVYFDNGDTSAINSKTITLKDNYMLETFNLADYDKNIQTVDASAILFDISITGNKLANKITGSSQDDTIDGGAGADTIFGGDGNDSILGGKGNDSLSGGKGNDTLTGGAGADIFVYTKGDGNDVITDYDEDDTIQINSDTVSKTTAKNGNIIFTLASKKKITITGGADKVITYVDPDGENTYPETVKFNSKGTAAILTSAYSKDEFKINDYDDYKNSVATINAVAVTHDLSITGNKLANKIIGSDEDDTIDGGNGADSILGGKGADSLVGGKGDDTLEGGKGNDILTGGAGADIFIYNSGDGNDVIADYAEADTIQINSATVGKITAKNGNVIFTVGKNKITVTGGADKIISYVDADGEHTYPEAVKFNSKGTAATLTSAYSQDEFKINDYDDYKNSVVTIDASAVTHDISITGNKLANKIIGSDEDDTIDGGSGADSILGGKGADSLVGGKGDDTLEGGTGNDNLTGGAGADIFVYNSGDGNDLITDYTEADTIQINSATVGKITAKNGNVIFTVGKNKITITGGADKVISYVDADGEHTYPEAVKFNSKGTAATLTSAYSQDEFKINDYDDYKNSVVTINAAAVTHDLSITGNKLANKIIGSDEDDTIDGGDGADSILGGKGADSLVGGKGDDTLEGGTGNDILTGGKGADVFVYNSGDGNDIIADYAEADTIQINSATVGKITAKNGNVIFTVDKNKITITGGADKVISYVDAEGEHTYPEAVKFNSKGTAATLTSAYSQDEFKINDYDDYKNSVVMIDASAVNHDISITGNKLANKIIGSDEDDLIDGGNGADSILGGKGADSLVGGKGDDTLEGGKGNDSLWGGAGDDTLFGGDGADIFVYNSGEGNDVIADFTKVDSIMILSGKVGDYVADNSNVTFEVGNGSIVVQNGADKHIRLVDSSGNLLKSYSPNK